MSNIAIGFPTGQPTTLSVVSAGRGRKEVARQRPLFFLPFLIIASISQLIYRGIVAAVLQRRASQPAVPAEPWFIANTDEANKHFNEVVCGRY